MPDAPLLDLVVRLRNHVADPADGLADGDLLQRYVRERDAVAFEALVWRHARLVMGVCRRALRHRQDAEDAFQATFLLLARKSHRIRRGAALAAWLHTTAVRVAGRARKRRLARPAELPDVLIDDVPPELREAGTVLDDAIRRLPARLRTAFVMCELEGRTHADAARELGCPKGTIDSRMAAARRRLRDRLVRRGITLSPAIIVGAIGNEWALGELPRQLVSHLLGCRPGIGASVLRLAAPTMPSLRITFVIVGIVFGTVGMVVAFSAREPTSETPKKGVHAKEPSRFVVSTSPAWKRTTVGLPEDEDLAEFRAHQRRALHDLTELYTKTIAERRAAGRPLVSPCVPSGLDSLVFYSNDLGHGAIGLRDKKLREGLLVNPGRFFTNFDSLQSLVLLRQSEMGTRQKMDEFLRFMKPNATSELMLHRTLSTSFGILDDYLVTVGEMGILPTMEWTKSEKNTREIQENCLQFWDLYSGKLRIKLSGRDNGTDEVLLNCPIACTLYLGPPFGADESVYALHQDELQVRLTSLHWKPLQKYHSKSEENGKALVQFKTDLVVAPEPLGRDPHRRIHAIHLTKANDLILCPTHLGRVVAVEAKNGKIRWTREYAPLDAKRFPTFAPEWVVVPPVVVGDKYVYAPADFPELLCLNVADGKKVWSVKKDDGLYPAVVGEQVLVIGAKTLRSLSLKDGSERWKLDLPGLPCGRGAMLGDTYLLPFSEPKTWKGMIAIVDPKAGKIIEVLKPEKDEPIGNLVVHQDFLISQTLTEIAAFPIKKKE